ncbi:MAG: hypothetical protein HYV02_08735 [Deltaproteobacteria bacterium]|nr:hypothetical protein [Deltaproteobacteria bacterium]
MFLWRWFKRLIYLAIFGAILYAASGYIDIHGKPARVYADEFFRSDLWTEGTKDLRTWMAALLRVASKKIEEGVTPEDQEKLNAIIENDLREQIEGVKAERKTE